jgi:hypothetical protein
MKFKLKQTLAAKNDTAHYLLEVEHNGRTLELFLDLVKHRIDGHIWTLDGIYFNCLCVTNRFTQDDRETIKNAAVTFLTEENPTTRLEFLLF